jgi:hypothetical protein
MVVGNSSAVLASDGEEGDQIIDVATRAGTIAAGLNAEFDRERDRLLSLGEGVGEGGPSDIPGVDGRRW